MKKAGSSHGGQYVGRPKVNRPGVHSKTKTSNHKRSKNYRKSYRGQGK